MGDSNDEEEGEILMAELLYLDESDTNASGDERICQSFTPDADWLVTGVWLDNVWHTTAKPMTAYLCADNSTKPGTVLRTSDAFVVPATSAPGAEGIWTFSDVPYICASATLYWIVWYSTQEDANTYDTTGASAETGSGTYSAPTWTINDTDLCQFKVIGQLAGVANTRPSGHIGFTTRSPWRHRR
jgi:hypothetical protein